MSRRLYIETVIRAEMADVWCRTQDPVAHARWDARFGRIDDLPGAGAQRFRYVRFGVEGVGITVGESHAGDGRRTSALRFASDRRLSPIRSGSGYWRYEPTPGGIRFSTGYDYRPGWGRLPDLVVRPLMRWLTAWSFDRLRLWLERGLPPERSRNIAIADVGIRLAATAAASAAGPLGPVAAALLVLGLPPLPQTPAARRVRRRPRGAAPAPAPDSAAALLARLERP